MTHDPSAGEGISRGRSADFIGFDLLGRLLPAALAPRSRYVHFAPRGAVPVLLLGTPAEHKHRVVYEASHNIPRIEMMKEVINWMDKYWGPPPSQPDWQGALPSANSLETELSAQHEAPWSDESRRELVGARGHVGGHHRLR
jgi:hypothetical protein